MNLHPCPLCGESKGYVEIGSLYLGTARLRCLGCSCEFASSTVDNDAAWSAAAAHAQGLREREQQTKAYATTLAVSLHAQHFSEVTQWEPLPDTLGLLTQIDNMVVGLRERIAELEAQRVPLTDEQIADAVREADLDWHHGWTLDETEANRFTQLVRAVERAHGIEDVKP